MSGSPVRTIPSDVFRGLINLRAVIHQNYKVCCKDVLPPNFDENFCFAPQDEISSCEDLLQSGTYRGFPWLSCLLSITGNVFCFVIRSCVQRSTSKSGFNVFVTNFCLADLLMGVYIIIIFGVANVLFRGRYLYHAITLKSSAACKVTGFLFLLYSEVSALSIWLITLDRFIVLHFLGFLSLLYSEVSALSIWLITLDRFIVLHFPFSSWRFQRGSAAAACLMTWLMGCVLAAVPLLPVTSH